LPGLAAFEEERRSGCWQGAGELQTAERSLDSAAIVDPRHVLLAELAALRVGDSGLFLAGLLREVLGPEVDPEARQPGLDAERFEHLKARRPGAPGDQVFDEELRDRGRDPGDRGRRAQARMARELDLGAGDRDLAVPPRPFGEIR